MGLNKGGNNKTYLKIYDGKIAKRVDANTPGAIKCTNKEQTKEWWEDRYFDMTAKIIGVRKRIPETKNVVPQLCLELQDTTDYYELQMPWSSGYSNGFFLAMPNIPFNEPIIIQPWMKIKEDGSKKVSLYFKKIGEKDSIQWYWTKDDPKDLPPLVQVKVKGQLVWDDTKRQEYFEKYIKEKIEPLLANNKSEVKAENETKDNKTKDNKSNRGQGFYNPPHNLPSTDDGDDLPFN